MSGEERDGAARLLASLLTCLVGEGGKSERLHLAMVGQDARGIPGVWESCEALLVTVKDQWVLGGLSGSRSLR